MLTAAGRTSSAKIFERQVEVGIANLAEDSRARRRRDRRVFLCGTDFGTQTSSFCSVKTFDSVEAALRRVLPTGFTKTPPGRPSSTPAARRSVLRVDDRRRDRHLNPGPMLGQRHGPADAEGEIQGRLVFWGGGVDTQRTLPFGTPAEVRAEVLERCEIFAGRRFRVSPRSITFRPTRRSIATSWRCSTRSRNWTAALSLRGAYCLSIAAPKSVRSQLLKLYDRHCEQSEAMTIEPS